MKFKENLKFEQFKKTLRDCGLITLTSGRPPGIKDENRFLELGFALYLLWIHLVQPYKRILLYFTPIAPNVTLFLVSPYDARSHFSLPLGHTTGTFYIDSLETLHSTNPANCNYCYLRNSFFINLSHFKSTNAFKSFLTNKMLVDIQDVFKHKKPDNCDDCANYYRAWLRNKVQEDERYGILLGGYPAILNIDSNVFRLLFTEPVELNRMAREATEYIDFFLTIFLANYLKAKRYSANTNVSVPFTSNEVDCIVLAGEPPNHNLLVVETTSYHHDRRSIQNKCTTYSALKTCLGEKYLYLYLTLAPEFLVKYRNGSVAPINGFSEHFGSFYQILHGNPDVELITLSSQHRDLIANLKKDWWDTSFLRGSFDYYLQQLRQKTAHLRTQQL